MSFFDYGEAEIEHLKKRDKKLGIAIDDIGMIKRKTNTDLFSSLISSIISQQISTKAAITITDRLMDLAVKFTPENIDRIELEMIQKCGMSLRKADYIKGIAKSALTKEIDFENLHKLSDHQVIKELTQLKGVGEWTCEMILIHSLQRRDVLSYKDLAIRRGLMKLHQLQELSKETFEMYRKNYSPYNTVASLYLWEISKK